MQDIAASLMIKALDGLSARAIATAENIANAGSPGFRPLRVTFEDALRLAAGNGIDAIRTVEPKVQLALPDAVSTGLRLDLELATASATTLRYSALVEILNRRMQIEALAVAGGR